MTIDIKPGYYWIQSGPEQEPEIVSWDSDMEWWWTMGWDVPIMREIFCILEGPLKYNE